MNTLNLMKGFLVLGDMGSENESLAAKVKYKERIVFATMRSYIPDWETPRDWDTITNEVKMERLLKLEEIDFNDKS